MVDRKIDHMLDLCDQFDSELDRLSVEIDRLQARRQATSDARSALIALLEIESEPGQ
jgi:hypothetical protein